MAGGDERLGTDSIYMATAYKRKIHGCQAPKNVLHGYILTHEKSEKPRCINDLTCISAGIFRNFGLGTTVGRGRRSGPRPGPACPAPRRGWPAAAAASRRHPRTSRVAHPRRELAPRRGAVRKHPAATAGEDHPRASASGVPCSASASLESSPEAISRARNTPRRDIPVRCWASSAKEIGAKFALIVTACPCWSWIAVPDGVRGQASFLVPFPR